MFVLLNVVEMLLLAQTAYVHGLANSIYAHRKGEKVDRNAFTDKYYESPKAFQGTDEHPVSWINSRK